jgi:hypothetical protein
MGRLTALFVSTVALITFPAAAAQLAPILLKEQGHLIDRHGVIVTGRVTLTFALYFTPAGGRPLWQERHTLTPVNGSFSILLGEARPFPSAIFDGGPLYLAVRLNNDAEVLPREELAGVSPALITGTSSRPSSPPSEGITPVALRSAWTQTTDQSADETAPAAAATRVVPEVSSFTAAPRDVAPKIVSGLERNVTARASPPVSSFAPVSSVVALQLPPGDAHCPMGGTKLVTGTEETFVCEGAFAVIVASGASSPSAGVKPLRPPSGATDAQTGDAPQGRTLPVSVETAPVPESLDQRQPPETWITCGENRCEAHSTQAYER